MSVLKTPGIVLNPELTSELIEFWGFRYKEVKQELDNSKATGGQKDDVPTYSELKRSVEHLKEEAARTALRLEENEKFVQDLVSATRNEYKAIVHELETCKAEKNQLVIQLGRSDTERMSLYHQVHKSYSQAISLAAEADRQRMVVVSELYPSRSLFEHDFTPSSLEFRSPEQTVRALRRDSKGTWQFYFLPCPPTSLPLRVAHAGQSGYWFNPFNISPIGTTFELVAEVQRHKWVYFGRYVTGLLPGHEMKMSEWISLEEQVKATFCSHIASQMVPGSQAASYGSQAGVRQRYDSGQWSIQCYTLECVGYDMALYDALVATVAKVHQESDGSVSQLIGKRRRTDAQLLHRECENPDTGNNEIQPNTTRDGALEQIPCIEGEWNTY
ncbi:hypothetical protein B0H11DRAFT_2237533 [Mycena galericulata]|nr:hypothetical protein B0H11DRAFT_2237533 [Mycena galericulata]